jgi:purine catabolism regulator
MHRLHDRTRDGQLRRLHHELLLALLADPADAELARRFRLAGVPVERCRYVGLVLRPAGTLGQAMTASLDELVGACLRAAELVRSPGVVAASESDVRVLLPIAGRNDPVRLADEFAGHVRARVPVVTAAGSVATSMATADRTLREAIHVMASLRQGHDTSPVHRLADLHLRGLLALLTDDDRLQAFTERELAPLRHADRTGELLHTTRVVIEHWGSKSAAAAALNISRPVLYDRIARIERVLGADLSDAEVRSSLHVALLADAGTPARRT